MTETADYDRFEDLESLNDNVYFEDYQVTVGDVDFSVDGVAMIIDFNIVEIVVDGVYASDGDGGWEASPSRIGSLKEFLSGSDDFYEHVIGQLEVSR